MTRLHTHTPLRRVHALHDLADERFVSVAYRQHEPVEMLRQRLPRAARRPSPRATARIRERMPLHSRVKPRRRLRREVRQAGIAILLVAPLLIAVSMLLGLPKSNASVNSRAGVFSDLRPPAVSLIFDAVRPDPVVLPGYVLPDDGAEESSHHAGG